MDFWQTDIWKTLGLEPGADINAIRKAYSEKVKGCHPEDDPVGFMRLRSAYKAAIQLASEEAALPPTYYGHDAVPPFDFYAEHAQWPIDPPQPGQQSRFDFSDIHAEAQEAQPEPEPKQSGFGFSSICEEEPAHPHEPEPTRPQFDFSHLEEDVKKSVEAENQIADDIIARFIALYESPEYSKSSAWEAILIHSDMRRLQRSEYFTREFLDFIARYTNIPPGIRVAQVSPLLEEWRTHWNGTELWYEFDIANQQIVAVKEILVADIKKTHRALILIGGLAGAIIAIATAAIVTAQIPLPEGPGVAAMRFLIGEYRVVLQFSLLFALIPAIWSALQLRHFFKIRRMFKGLEGTKKTAGRSALTLAIGVCLAAVATVAVFAGISEVSIHREDIAQIRERQLYLAPARMRGLPTTFISPTWAWRIMRVEGPVVEGSEGLRGVIIPPGFELEIDFEEGGRCMLVLTGNLGVVVEIIEVYYLLEDRWPPEDQEPYTVRRVLVSVPPVHDLSQGNFGFEITSSG